MAKKVIKLRSVLRKAKDPKVMIGVSKVLEIPEMPRMRSRGVPQVGGDSGDHIPFVALRDVGRRRSAVRR